MIGIAWKETVEAGKNGITEGDLVGDYFYIVQEGYFEVYVSKTEEDENENEENSDDMLDRDSTEHVSSISAGGSFGELALMYFVPRAATVKAITASTVWVIDRTNFKAILMQASEDKIKQYIQYLSR